MRIDSSSIGQTFVELAREQSESMPDDGIAYLDRFFHIFRIVFLDVVMRTNGVFEFLINNDAGPLRTWACDEQHDTSANVRIERLEKSCTCRQVALTMAYL